MAAPNLEGIDLKLGHADKHLALLEDAHQAYYPDAGNIRLEHYPASRECVIRSEDTPPPAWWGLEVSGWAHMLRSSLDNLVWGLVELRGGKPGRHTQFPIYDKKPAPPRKSGGARKCRSERDPWQGIKGVLPPDTAFIKGAQPYQLGRYEGVDLARWHPLSMLGYLNNVDKHRYLHPAMVGGGFYAEPHPQAKRIPVYFSDLPRVIALMSGKFSATVVVDGETLVIPLGISTPTGGHPFALRFHGQEVTTFEPPRPDDDPAVIMRFTDLPDFGEDPEMKMEPAPTLGISVSGRERPIDINDLYEIRRFVGEVVDHFRPELV